MEQHGQHSHPERTTADDRSFDRRQSRRLSLKEMVGAAIGAVAKIAEPRKEVDPEDEPGFTERHPLWEDELPPIYPHEDHVPDLLALEDAAPQAPIAPNVPSLKVEQPHLSDSALRARERWKRAYTTIKKNLALRNQALRSSIGIGGELEGLAFGVWDRYSPSRIYLFQSIYNKKIEYAIFILIILHVVIMILKASKKGSLQTAHITMDQLNILDTVLTFIFSVECVARMACLGLYKGPKTYLRNSYYKLDLISVIDSWAHLIATRFFKKISFLRFLVLRLFRALLTLREIEFFSQVLAIFEALRRSMEPLEDVMLLAIVLLFFYSLIGLQFFASDMAYRCLRKSDLQFSYPVLYCSHFSDRGFKCPSNQVCKKVGGNPGYGSQSFDMFPFSMLTLFQVVSLEGWSFVMYTMGNVEFRIAVAYFITLVVIVSYFLINIVVAAISGVFLRVRHEHQALLKKNRSAKNFSFYNATVLASILKDVILEDNKKMSCTERFRKRSEQMKAKLTKAMSKTGSRMKRGTQSFGSSFRVSRMDTLASMDYDWDPEGRTMLSRKYSRSLSRSMTRSMSMGARAARKTVSSKCRALVGSKLFAYSERFAISANLLLLCLHHEGMPNKLFYSLYALEALFIIVFTAEMVLRFLAVGLVEYMDDQINVWDTFIIAISAGSIMTRAYPNISGARMLRWFYVNKKETKKHTSIVADCISGLGALSAVSFFYILIIFIFSVVGMQLYAGEFYQFYDGYPRDNFDSIFNAMFLWFTCTTADNWVNQMWNAMRPGVANNWIAPFIFVPYFIITVFLVLNLIIAVILEKTELSDSQKKQIQKAEYLKHLRSRQKRLFSAKGSGTWLVGAVEGATAGVKSISQRLYTRKVRNITIPRPNNPHEVSLSRFSRQMTTAEPSQVAAQQYSSPADTSASVAFRPSMQGLVRRPSLAALTTPPGSAIIGKRASQILFGTGFPVGLPNQQAPNTALRSSILALVNQPSNIGPLSLDTLDQPLLQQQQSRKPLFGSESRASFELEEYEEMGKSFRLRNEVPWYLSNTSLFIFSADSELRLLCHKIITSKIFNFAILGNIAISASVVITMSQASGIDPVFAKLNIFVFTMFALEFLLKIIAFGFLLTPDPYLGDVYNFLDLFLLILDALFLVPSWNPTQLVVVRILSAFRPLRLLCRIQGMKVLTTNLLRTIPAVMSVLAFTLIVFSVFAVVGVQLFSGRYSSCNSSVDHKIHCVGTDLTSAQILGPRVWSNPSYHFDNFPSALLSLFIISTFDNVQVGFIYPAMDIDGPKGTQPVQNESPMNAIFFLVFICIGGFFILRMFVGVFIDQFGLISGSKLLTERQKLLRDTNRIIQHMTPIYKPKVPRFWFRRLCHRIVTSPKYPPIMRGVVLVNYTWLSSHFAGQPAFLTVHRNRIEASFATFFVLDITVKLLGYEVRDFISEPWNVFELCNAIVSETMIMPDTLSLRKTIGRVPMGLRVFRVIRYTPRLNILLRTVLVSMIHMLDIVWLLGILLVSFSIIGVQMFGTLRDGVCIGPDMKFANFSSAFVTLFQIMTGDNWSCILTDAQAEFPFCTLHDSIRGSNCGNSAFALVYFVLFITLATHIFMNMFVASIIDTITFGLLKEKTIITPANLTEYQLLWNDNEFDPTSKGYIGLHKLRSFVDRLGIPLGRRHNAAPQWYARIEWEVLTFHVDEKGVPFRELLETLTLYKIGSRGLELAVRIEREKQIQKIYKLGATIKIQAAIKGFLVRRHQAKKKSEQKAPAGTKMTSMLFE